VHVQQGIERESGNSTRKRTNSILRRESRKKEDAMNEQIKQSLSRLLSAIVFK